jgi:branched-subunit amino acid transport protein
MNQLWTVLGGTLITWLERYPILALAGRLHLPAPVARALKYVPPAVLAAIVVPDVLIRDERLSLSFANAQLIATLVGGVVIWLTRNLLLTIVTGMLTLLTWRWFAHG